MNTRHVAAVTVLLAAAVVPVANPQVVQDRVQAQRTKPLPRDWSGASDDR